LINAIFTNIVVVYFMLEKKQFYINGEWIFPSKSNDVIVINPSNEEPYATISLGSLEDTNKAVKAISGWK